jgi:hypothetical protein
MRSRLLARAAALVLAVGGLLVIPTSPASADCSHPNHPNEYTGGGIDFQNGGTPIRSGPHPTCPLNATGFPSEPIDVHCARNEDGTIDDWVFLENGADGNGWAREHTLTTSGNISVPQCASSGFMTIGDA